jgi:hypothetical protein
MADSKRLATQKSLTALLETITEFDLLGRVYRGRKRIGDETELPCLIIFEQPPGEGDRVSGGVSKDEWFIGIQGFISPDLNHPTDTAHQLMAAVKAKLHEVTFDGAERMAGPNYMLGGLINDLHVDGGMCFAPDETGQGCYFGLKLTVNITEDLGDIYVP